MMSTIFLCNTFFEAIYIQSYMNSFRAKRSTVTATLKVVYDIKSAIGPKFPCVALFINYCKAFDTVDHSFLIGSRGCGEWFRSYLSEQSQTVKHGSIISYIQSA